MAITILSSTLPERYSKNPSQPVNSVFFSRSSLKNSPSLCANILSWRVFDSSRARRRMPRLFVNWSMSSLFPILRLPYITMNSALVLSNLWLRSESSLCLLMNTLISIILESVLFIICAVVGDCARHRPRISLRSNPGHRKGTCLFLVAKCCFGIYISKKGTNMNQLFMNKK